MQGLPDVMQIGTLMYVPQIGYLLAVERWPNMPQDLSEYETENLQFMFFVNEKPHFKTEK